jgi:hypothetical protein
MIRMSASLSGLLVVILAGLTGLAQPPSGRVLAPVALPELKSYAGDWTFKYLGVPGPFGAPRREGTLTVGAAASDRGLTMTIESLAAAGSTTESVAVTLDSAGAELTVTRNATPSLTGRGSWISPGSLRIIYEPVTIDGHGYRLRQLITLVSPGSFMIHEEISIDDAPFSRLGSAIVLRKK